MPIRKEVEAATGSVPARTLPVTDFTYSSDALAQMIIDAWVDSAFQDALLERDSAGKVTPAAALTAKVALAEKGVYLDRAVVISEDEFDNTYTVPLTYAGEEVVFVLPNPQRVTPRPGQSLLDTARLLMATTPNGI
jgi:hypothetical protein